MTILESPSNRKLWYRKPAANWNEALPLGNGRIGAMVFGHPTNETIALNEDSIWYGEPQNRINPDAAAVMTRVRKLIFEGKVREAEELALVALAGVPEHPAHYVPLGELHIDFANRRSLMGQNFDRTKSADPDTYYRELDIETAVNRVTYAIDGVRFTRECFVSAPDQAMVLRVSAGKSGALDCAIRINRERYAGRTGHIGRDTVYMHASGGGGPGAVEFAAMFRAMVSGGQAQTMGETILIEKADSFTLVLCAASSFRHADPEQSCLDMIDAASSKSYETLLERHAADYGAFFNRVDLRFGNETDPGNTDDGTVPGEMTNPIPNTGATKLAKPSVTPTDERLETLRAGGSDVDLAELYFHFGRYLMISCSRPGTLPANLQGIWNPHFLPPWGSKFTININTQMNYWPAEVCGLGDCHQPLFDLMERMVPNGQRTARDMYGCRGFVAHHNTDLWGDTAPVDRWIPASIWPMSAAWLSLHIWEHWEYGGNLGFLRENFYIMKEAALFMLDFLVQDSKGRLVTNPSLSPENTYILESGELGSMCYGPAMDNQILYKLFSACAEACTVLGEDADFSRACLLAREQLPKPDIGRLGQLMEWSEDYTEAEPGHRHISHLFALYPADQISPIGTPMLAKAARRTLEARLSMGGGHTGWSRAWIINLWARLHEGEKAWENITELLRSSTLPNLFDNHPPFQIDGNFGGTAGIVEMIVQCVRGEIRLLPALSRETASGRVRGIRLKGGFRLDMVWRSGNLHEAALRATRRGLCKIRLGTMADLRIEGKDVSPPVTSPEPGLYVFETEAGHLYRLSLQA